MPPGQKPALRVSSTDCRPTGTLVATGALLHSAPLPCPNLDRCRLQIAHSLLPIGAGTQVRGADRVLLQYVLGVGVARLWQRERKPHMPSDGGGAWHN